MTAEIIQQTIETIYPIEMVLPHQNKMRLLERVLQIEPGHLQAETTIQSDNIFLINQRVSSIIGIELMAQGIAAYAGSIERNNGLPPRIGLLIGTRKFITNVPYFYLGERLQIDVREVYIDENGLALFDCEIHGETAYLQSKISVYHPQSIEEI